MKHKIQLISLLKKFYCDIISLSQFSSSKRTTPIHLRCLSPGLNDFLSFPCRTIRTSVLIILTERSQLNTCNKSSTSRVVLILVDTINKVCIRKSHTLETVTILGCLHLILPLLPLLSEDAILTLGPTQLTVIFRGWFEYDGTERRGRDGRDGWGGRHECRC